MTPAMQLAEWRLDPAIARSTARSVWAHARPRKLRTMREFAEQEIRIPTGRYAGRKFRCSRQPFNGLWFDAIDSGLWQEYWCTGPSQASKTTVGFIIPTLYHLFEQGETVICGLPDLNMASDKWTRDLLPAIRATKFRSLLPKTGPGSRGGDGVVSLTFGNGAVLRFMTAGGGDKQRSGYTSRVLVLTEVDGFGIGNDSVESDKITQIKARTRSFENSRIYGECTVTIPEGRIWQEVTTGTDSRIATRCPLCGAFSIPPRDDSERDRLIGWRDAEDVIAAREAARFTCAACEKPWTEEQRYEANAAAVLVHAGQSIVDLADVPLDEPAKPIPGTDQAIRGPLPRVRSFGFRWGPINNHFLTPADIAEDEFRAALDPDEDNAARYMSQFVWALPYRSSLEDVTPLTDDAVIERSGKIRRGRVPVDAAWLTVGVDIGKKLMHYVVLAWLPDGRSHLVEYGTLEVPSNDHAIESALTIALAALREMCLDGWPLADGSGLMVPAQVWIDANWQGGAEGPNHVVYAFVREHMVPGQQDRFRPIIGRGAGQYAKRYTSPRRTGKLVSKIGKEFDIRLDRPRRVRIVTINVDFWKASVHRSLISPADEPGALRLFDGTERELKPYARHITAEKLVTEQTPRGKVTKWVAVRARNHWLDATCIATVAGEHLGATADGPAAAPATRSLADFYKRK